MNDTRHYLMILEIELTLSRGTVYESSIRRMIGELRRRIRQYELASFPYLW